MPGCAASPTRRPPFDRRLGTSRTLILVTLCSAALTACFTSAADFKSDAEAFIADRVADELDTTFTNVNCVAPVDQQIGTRFACSAIDANGGVWEFDNVIDVENEFTVNIARRP